MDFKQLEAFVEVAQSGSFSKAARKLFLTQPTISAHIAALEKELRRNLINIPDDKYDAFMADMARRMRLKTAEEMYASVGYGGIQLSRLMSRIKEEYAKSFKPAPAAVVTDVPIKK